MTARLCRFGNIIVLIVPVALASCNDGQATMIRGSAITRPSVVPAPPPPNGFNITPILEPPTIPFHILPVFGCPSTSPFVTNFSLVIDQRGGTDVFVHEVGLRFVDGGGFDSPLFLGQGELVTLFGSTLVVGGTSRTFPFQPRFGCGLSSTPRMMFLRLLLRDQHGRMHERTLTAHAERSR